MTHVVTESCIKCKFTDCVDVCPVDCFREGPNMLVIDPDECIDCAVCIPECPVEAIRAEEDVPADQQQFIALTATRAGVIVAGELRVSNGKRSLRCDQEHGKHLLMGARQTRTIAGL